MKLTIAFFASALAFASSPGLAVDLPDNGSKNFSPSDGTPTYFANEDVSVSARTADTSERDWSAVDAIAPGSPVGHARSAHRAAGRHGSGRHATGGSAARYYGTRSVSVRYHAAPVGAGKTMSAKHGKLGGRHASAATHTAI